MNQRNPLTRRHTLKVATIAVAAPFVSRLSWAQGSPMQKLQYAAIGAAGRGGFDIGSMTGHEKIRIVAAADVDAAAFTKLNQKFNGVKTFADWREMFQTMNEGTSRPQYPMKEPYEVVLHVRI